MPIPSRVQTVAEGTLMSVKIAAMVSTWGSIASPAKVKVDVRDLSPNITVLERRQVGLPGPLMVGPIGQEKEIIVTNYKWTITMFVPRDATNKEFDRHELNFVGLTREQYDQDKELLDPIIKSLQYDASAAPLAATTQATP